MLGPLLLLLALFAVALALLLLGRVSELVLSLLSAALVLGLLLLVLSVNVGVSGAVAGVPPRMQGAMTLGAVLLGSTLFSFVWKPARAQQDKLVKFRRVPATAEAALPEKAAPARAPRPSLVSRFKLPKVGSGNGSSTIGQLTRPNPRTRSRNTRATRTGTGTRTGGTLRTAMTAKGRMPQRVGTTSDVYFQDYEVLERVGIGGMGSVYRAKRRQDDKIVALKVPQDKYLADAKFVKRFYREAEVLKRFTHPNIVRVYDYRMQAPEHYIAMEYLDGDSLEDLIERRTFTYSEGAQMIRALADALRHIHMQNVIHRDIKPANVMVLNDAFTGGKLREGGIKLMDFGIAVGKVLTRLTMTGARVGTPIYMAPEQAKGNRVDARSDVYSLGLLAYELVTGETAFKGSYEAVVHQQVFEQPKPPKQVRLSVPGKLSDLILHMIEKDPAMRPTLDEVIARIDAGVLDDEVFTDPVALALGVGEKSGTLRLLDMSGKLRLSLSDQGPGKGDLPVAPIAVTGDAQGNIYVAMPDHQQAANPALLRKFGPDGEMLRVFGNYGLNLGDLLRPTSLAVWEENLYVLDAESHYVSVYGPQGDFLFRFGGQGAGMGKFNHPSTLKIGADGQVYVLDHGNREVQRFTLQGEYVSRYAFRLDRNTDQLRELDGLGVDRKGSVYIVDGVARKVRKIEADGSTGATFALETLVGEPAQSPWLLAISDDGRIYAVRQGGQILRTFSASGDMLNQRDMYAPVQALALVDRPASVAEAPAQLPVNHTQFF